MLSIKENIDMKELEKFGYVKYEKMYCKATMYYEVRIDSNTREITQYFDGVLETPTKIDDLKNNNMVEYKIVNDSTILEEITEKDGQETWMCVICKFNRINFYFGSPKENSYCFCQHCGRKIIEYKFIEKDGKLL